MQVIRLLLGHKSGLSSNDCVLNKHRKHSVIQKKGQVKTKGEFYRQAKGRLELPKLQREEGGGALPHSPRGKQPANTLISEPLEVWDSQFLRFKPLACRVLLEQPQEMNTQAMDWVVPSLQGVAGCSQNPCSTHDSTLLRTDVKNLETRVGNTSFS